MTSNNFGYYEGRACYEMMRHLKYSAFWNNLHNGVNLQLFYI
jgi:hypothetical protein